jgi:rare lipoprotein A
MLILSACHGKKVRVASSAPSPRSTSPNSTPPTSSASPAPSKSELVGLASYYAEPYHGRKTANGETFDTYQELTAAHKTLPFNTVVKVTNENNGKDVEVRINDRGPFIDGRVIDLSLKAAREIDMVRAGVVPVKLEILKEGTPVRPGVRALGPPAPNPPAAVYTIQVGAFDTQVAAEELQRDLEKRYRDVTIQTVSVPRTFYRVRVGRASDLASAEKLSKQLRDESFDPFVVRLN